MTTLLADPPISDGEADRVAELDKLEVMYSQPEEVFDRMTRQLAEAFGAPAVLMNLIDKDNQFIKSAAGVAECDLGNRTMPRKNSICSYVVQTNEPLIVEDLAADERFRDNPFVKAKGLRFYAGAPLRCEEDGQAMGTLCVLDFKPRKISERERRLLRMLADSLMTEVKLRRTSRQLLERTRTMERDLAAARNVQRFLLPPRVQEGRGFAVWHYYHPFDAIGGDFLDARLRPDGSVATLLADVSGHGPSAALTSAMVKTTFQRAALAAALPGDVLSAVGRDLGLSMESGQFITASAALYDPAQRQVTLASAGHPFPILLRGGRARVIDTVNDLPLLIEPEQVYDRHTTLGLMVGDRLIFYTDGATEAADRAGNMLEVAGLMPLLEANEHRSGGQFLDGVFQGVRGFAAGQLRDDVALVCLEVK